MHTCTQVCQPSGGDDEDLKMYVTETIPMVVFSFFSSPLSFTLIKMPVSQPLSFPPTSFYLSLPQLSLPLSPLFPPSVPPSSFSLYFKISLHPFTFLSLSSLLQFLSVFLFAVMCTFYCVSICLWLPFFPPLSPSQQAHQETFKQLLQHLYRLLQCRYIQEHDSDELRKDLDKCIKLLHNISKILITQNWKNNFQIFCN